MTFSLVVGYKQIMRLIKTLFHRDYAAQAAFAQGRPYEAGRPEQFNNEIV